MNTDDSTTGHGFSTLGIHGGAVRGAPGDSVVPPLVQSATFLGGGPDDRLMYSRYGNNPLQELVGRKIAALEGCEAGLVLGSGMGAISSVLLAFLEQGDHIVASRHLYGATLELLEVELPRRGVTTTFVEPTDVASWREAITDRTRILYLEAPTNPTLRIVDPRPAAEAAASAGVGRDIRVVMDATFATPVNLRPASLGVDLVVHSATKYLGGHSDIIAGAVAGSEADIAAVTTMMKRYGAAADPHMVWLLDRGLRTLEVRMRRHNENALALARFLESHPAVEQVLHPGLESHPDHALARELFPHGTGGMVSFMVRGGGEAADLVMSRLQLVQAAPSLGGVESLVSQPRYTSHRAMTAEGRGALGIPDGFLRVSAGIEDVGDLVGDVREALA
ncbi:trans-sulfuration enzyme family protein [Gaopeijia maritima]|uniref:Aminotransferase class I/II-fold pyridoxal phosphate-dependent enzyme n=1 Tax=Gaopeijia maritima TaxID=3119007 RepID=A0ABU9E791_9BACT